MSNLKELLDDSRTKNNTVLHKKTHRHKVVRTRILLHLGKINLT